MDAGFDPANMLGPCDDQDAGLDAEPDAGAVDNESSSDSFECEVRDALGDWHCARVLRVVDGEHVNVELLSRGVTWNKVHMSHLRGLHEGASASEEDAESESSLESSVLCDSSDCEVLDAHGERHCARIVQWVDDDHVDVELCDDKVVWRNVHTANLREPCASSSSSERAAKRRRLDSEVPVSPPPRD